MLRFSACLLLVLLLTACGGQDVEPTPYAPTVTPIPAPAQAVSAPAVAATPVPPTATPPLPENIPTLAVTQVAMDLSGRDRLVAVLTVQADVKATLLQTAADIQSGALDGMDGLGRLIGAATELLAIDEALSANYAPPLNVHAETARQIQAGLRATIGLWMDKEISSADVPAALVQYEPAAALAALP